MLRSDKELDTKLTENTPRIDINQLKRTITGKNLSRNTKKHLIISIYFAVEYLDNPNETEKDKQTLNNYLEQLAGTINQNNHLQNDNLAIESKKIKSKKQENNKLVSFLTKISERIDLLSTLTMFVTFILMLASVTNPVTGPIIILATIATLLVTHIALGIYYFAKKQPISALEAITLKLAKASDKFKNDPNNQNKPALQNTLDLQNAIGTSTTQTSSSSLQDEPAPLTTNLYPTLTRRTTESKGNSDQALSVPVRG